jgi:hypothetical protein
MPEFESLGEKRHAEAQVDLVESIIFGMGIKANLLRRDVGRNEHPDPQVVDDLIEKVRRLQIALEGCKVGAAERSSS